MQVTANLTDAAILQELGARLERGRIDAHLTQAELAREAGVSKRTVERVEAGHGSELMMLIRLLRALKLMDGLETLLPDRAQSPITLLKLRGRPRRRVGRPRRKGAEAQKPAGAWKWGE